MCSILEELKEEGRNEGRAEGIILIGKRYSLSDNEIINELLLNCEYTYEQAANILKQYDGKNLYN